VAMGVGVDLLEIERLERALERRPRLAARVFSEGELAYARQRARPARHLAARFAAKEAVVKALGLNGALGLGEIEIEPGEPPRVSLSGRAAEAARAQGVELSVSLTHSRETAAAVAVASVATG
jgi:holo-[acyl-carrier protein] synthase